MGPYCGTKFNSKVWLNTEPCGFICASLTWCLLLFGNYVYNSAIVIDWLGVDNVIGIINALLFNYFSIMALYCHLKAMFTDPGAVPKDALPMECDESEKDYEADINAPPFKKWCGRCKAFKPKRAHHCSVCGRCIIKMDHHCPWINNCVGISNHKYFLLFVTYIFLTCAYSLFVLGLWYTLCETSTEVKTFSHETNDPDSKIITHTEIRDVKCSTLNVLPYFALIESILFGLFTTCLLGDQYFLILNNMTSIERLKKKKDDKKDGAASSALTAPTATTAATSSSSVTSSKSDRVRSEEYDELVSLTSSTITSSSLTGSSSSPAPAQINQYTLASYKIVSKFLSQVAYIEKNHIKGSTYAIDNYAAFFISYEEYLSQVGRLINIQGLDKANESNLANTNELILLKMLNFNEIFFCYKKSRRYLSWLLPTSHYIENKKIKEIIYGYRLESEAYSELQQDDAEDIDPETRRILDHTLSEKSLGSNENSPFLPLGNDDSSRESRSISSVSSVSGPLPGAETGFVNEEIFLPAQKYNRTFLDDSPIVFDSFTYPSRRERSASSTGFYPSISSTSSVSSNSSISSTSSNGLLDRKDTDSMRKRV